MLSAKFVPFVMKHVIRCRVRSFLTVSGVALAMFLFCSIRSMQEGIRAATTATARDSALVVYRENRYCPFSSRLPESYARQIAAIPGVGEVTPIKILVSNCRASLDVLTFRGIPPERIEALVLRDGGRIVAGSVEEWRRRSDAALLGRRVAERRRLKVGDRFTIAGVTVFVAGVFDSSNVQHQNAAYTHLDFLQQSSGHGLGIVTQFNVKVDDPEKMTRVAAAIDTEFRSAQDPTATWGEKAFTARAMTDVVEIVRFAALLGWGALAAVFALVANAIFLSVQERIRDHAVLQTLGYGRRLIIELIVAESTLVSILGGAVGIALAAVALHVGKWTFSVEGTSVHFQTGGATILYGFVLCVGIGVLAGLAPAWQAGRRTITECFRAV